jgi:CDP-diacylglycerol--serine O-phosphatidyltransferase
MIVLGDKIANDFYIPPDEPFKAIGAVPYLYETNLRRFCKAYQKFIDAGQLDVRLWRHKDNTFHLKGLLVDEHYALLTGNNINPRAWRLDLENGLLIHDPNKLLVGQHLAELERILAHTQRLPGHEALDTFEAYPEPVQRLIKRLARVRADRLINQVL